MKNLGWEDQREIEYYIGHIASYSYHALKTVCLVNLPPLYLCWLCEISGAVHPCSTTGSYSMQIAIQVGRQTGRRNTEFAIASAKAYKVVYKDVKASSHMLYYQPLWCYRTTVLPYTTVFNDIRIVILQLVPMDEESTCSSTEGNYFSCGIA